MLLSPIFDNFFEPFMWMLIYAFGGTFAFTLVLALAYLVAAYIEKRTNKKLYSWFILGFLLAGGFAWVLIFFF